MTGSSAEDTMFQDHPLLVGIRRGGVGTDVTPWPISPWVMCWQRILPHEGGIHHQDSVHCKRSILLIPECSIADMRASELKANQVLLLPSSLHRSLLPSSLVHRLLSACRRLKGRGYFCYVFFYYYQVTRSKW